MKKKAASFPVVLGDFGCEASCQTCRENSPRIRARFQAASGNSDSANWPGYEAEKKKIITDPDNATNQSEHEQNTCSRCKAR